MSPSELPSSAKETRPDRCWLAGETPKAADWLADAMVRSTHATAADTAWLLTCLLEPPAGGTAARGRSCWLQPTWPRRRPLRRLPWQSRDNLGPHRCGTNCGSCVPELKRLQLA